MNAPAIFNTSTHEPEEDMNIQISTIGRHTASAIAAMAVLVPAAALAHDKGFAWAGEFGAVLHGIDHLAAWSIGVLLVAAGAIAVAAMVRAVRRQTRLTVSE